MYAPVLSGVYGISNAREWIYIGESDNIQNSLLNHLQDLRTSLMKREPTGFVFEVCEQERRTSRQDRLVGEYKPACNREAPQHS
jgi:excinuclease UvrABC nuclease subunit